MFAHASHGVCLNHRGDVGGFESADGQLRFGAGGVGMDDEEVGVVHRGIIGAGLVGEQI